MVALLENEVTARKPSFLGRPAAPLGLRIVSAERAGHLVRLANGKCTIGSAPGCTLRLHGRGFQPLHCVILRGPGGAAVRRWSADTRLNGGQFMTSSLKVGDRLAIGHVEFEVVELAEETVYEVPAPVAPPMFAPVVDAGLRERIAELAAEKQQLESELESVRGTLSTQAAKIDELSASVTAEQATRAALCQTKQEEIAGLQQEIAAKASALEASLAEWNTQRQTLEAAAQAALAELANEREGRAMAGDQALADWSSERQAFAAAARDAEARWQCEREALAAQALTAQSQLQSEREALEAVTQNNTAHWQAERQALEATTQNAQAEIDQLKLALANAEQRATQPPLEDHVTAAALQQLRQDRDAAQAQVNTLQQQCNELTASETDLRDEIERLAGALSVVQAAAQPAPEPKPDTEKLAHFQHLSDELTAREAVLAERVAAVEQRELQINHYLDELARQQADLENQRIALVEQQVAQTEKQGTCSPSPEMPASDANAPASQERSEPTEAVDVSSILARYSRTENTSEAAGVEKSYMSPQEAPARMATEASAPASSHRESSADTDEDSIEAYMARLLNRVRGESEPSTAQIPMNSRAVAPVSAPKVIPQEIVQAAGGMSEPQPARIQEAVQFAPRPAVRERSEDLAAMRELANQSARSHLDTHNKLQWGRTVVEKSIIGGAALSCGFALLVTPIFETSVITAFGAVVSLGTGIAWTVRAIRTYKEGKAAQKLADESRAGLEPPLATEAIAPSASQTMDDISAEEALADLKR